MATANYIITRAFTRLNIRAAETSLQADEIQDGLDLLNDLLSNWEALYNLGFSPVQGVADEVRVPRYAVMAIIDSLSIVMATEYARPVSPALLASAQMSLRNMLAASLDLTNVDMPSTLPLGSGNQCDDGDDRRFFTEPDTVNF